MYVEPKPWECFVLKAEEIDALNYLQDGFPVPERIEWINRGSDQRLLPTTVNQLLRTLHNDKVSPSVARLRDSAGLRTIFVSEAQRNDFADHFSQALKTEKSLRQHVVTAIFKSREQAEEAALSLLGAGVPQDSFCILSKAGELTEQAANWPEGHGKLQVTGAAAGGGILGAIFGLAVFAIPGVGPVAAAGAVAASAVSSVAAISGVIGATGGALSKVLSDFDVDGLAANYFQREVARGSVFMAIDTRLCPSDRDAIAKMLLECGGTVPRR